MTLIMTAYIVNTCSIAKHVHFEYGMYLVLWSCIVFVIQGTMASLANAAILVLTKVYTATHHHLGHVSSATPKSRVCLFGPKDRKGE